MGWMAFSIAQTEQFTQQMTRCDRLSKVGTSWDIFLCSPQPVSSGTPGSLVVCAEARTAPLPYAKELSSSTVPHGLCQDVVSYVL